MMNIYLNWIISFIAAIIITVYLAGLGFAFCIDSQSLLCTLYTLLIIVVPVLFAFTLSPGNLASHIAILTTIILIPSVLIDRGVFTVPDFVINLVTPIFDFFARLLILIPSFKLP